VATAIPTLRIITQFSQTKDDTLPTRQPKRGAAWPSPLPKQRMAASTTGDAWALRILHAPTRSI